MHADDLFRDAARSIIEGDEDRAMELIKSAQTRGVDLIELLQKGFALGNLRQLNRNRTPFIRQAGFLCLLLLLSFVQNFILPSVLHKMIPGFDEFEVHMLVHAILVHPVHPFIMAFPCSVIVFPADDDAFDFSG